MQLQTYTYNKKTYFIDYRLQQFRSNTPIIEFLDFKDEKGDKILCKMLKEGVAKIELLKL